MRIALVSREYPPETGVGGIGTYIHHISRALAGLGHEVHVFSRAPELPERSYPDDSVTVHRVQEAKYKGPLDWRLYRMFPITEYLYAKRICEKVWELHREKPFDVIEVPEYRAEGFFLVKNPPAPTVTKLHTPTRIANEINAVKCSFHETLVDWMERVSTKKTNLILSSSSSLADWTAKVWNMDRRKFHVVPNPITTSRWVAHPMPEGDPIVLFVGRLEKRKGFDLIGQAWPKVSKAIPNARLCIIGNIESSDLRNEFEQYGKEQGGLDRVEWIPWQANDALRQYYQNAHLVLIPSVFDNFPGVCLEAMASGRAVVASQSGGLADMVEDGVTGILFPPHDLDAFVAAQIKLLKDPKLRADMGMAAATRVEEKFGSSVIGKATEAAYSQAINHDA